MGLTEPSDLSSSWNNKTNRWVKAELPEDKVEIVDLNNI